MEERIAAGGIVIRKEKEDIKILLVKDGYGHWIWPEGHAEEGETIEETALREVTEETGIKDLKILGKEGTQEYIYRLGETDIHKTVHIFLMETSRKELILQASEIADGKWFSCEEAAGAIEYEGSKEILETAVKKYKEENND